MNTTDTLKRINLTSSGSATLIPENAKHISSKPNYFSAVFGGFSAVPVLKINRINSSNQVENHPNGGKLHFISSYMIHPQTVTTSVAHKTSFSAEIDQKVRFMIYSNRQYDSPTLRREKRGGDTRAFVTPA